MEGSGGAEVRGVNAACEAHRRASASGGGLAEWRREKKVLSSQGNGAFVGVEV